MTKFNKFFLVMILSIMTAFTITSCKDNKDEPATSSKGLVGTWIYTESYSDAYESQDITMTLTFNSDNTGSIVENWVYETKATSNETYKMNFSWSTTTDANGTDILRISYVSGDKNTELFYGSEGTVLWTREFVLTGKILNIYGGDGVWVFKKK